MMSSCGLILWISVVIHSIILIITIIIFIKSALNLCPNTAESKLLSYSAIITLIICCAVCIFNILEKIVWCLDDKWYIIWALYTIAYCLEFYFLCLYLFLKLCHVFQNTAFELSNRTKTIYRTIFATSPIIIVIILIMGYFVAEWSYFTSTIALIYAWASVVFLNYLFIKKLIQVNRNSDDNELLDVITKHTILATISLQFTVVVFITFGISSFIDNDTSILHLSDWIGSYSILFDVFTNSLCIGLSLHCFDKYYGICCGCMDKQCRKSCEKTVSDDRKSKISSIEMGPMPPRPALSGDPVKSNSVV